MILSLRQLTLASAMVATAHAQGVIVSATGDKGTSVALQVDQTANNDANVIKQSEIVTNVVNECGRTLLAGNIDIGEQTELALTAKKVTQTTAGGKIQVKINEGGAQGAGPYACDLDLTSNANGINGQTNLTVTEGAAQNGQIPLEVTMPADLKCVGASTGDVCTVRCRNAAEFGGCFAVQQTDTTPKVNTPDNIPTLQTLDNVNNQVAQNIKDLPAAASGIASSGPDGAEQGVAVVKAIEGDAANVGAGNATAGAGNSTAGAGNNNAGAGKANGKANGKGKAGKAAAKKGKAGNAAAGNAATGNAATGKATGKAGKARQGKAAKANAGNANGAAANANAGNASGAATNANAAKAKGNANAGANGNANNRRSTSMRWAKRLIQSGAE